MTSSSNAEARKPRKDGAEGSDWAEVVDDVLKDLPIPLPPGSWEDIRLLLGLSPRELQISLCVMGGLTEKGTARALGSSRATVHTHMERIYRKFEIGTRSALVAALFGAYVELQSREKP